MPEKSILTRRQFISLLLTAIPGASIAHAVTIEPEQLRVRESSLNISGPPLRFVHFTDLHYRGESTLTRKVAREISRIKPQFACFTGDLIDTPDFKEGAFDFIRSLSCPVYAVPGNHDYRSGVPFKEFAEAFSSTGGGWLENGNILVPDADLELVGIIDGNGAIPRPFRKTGFCSPISPRLWKISVRQLLQRYLRAIPTAGRYGYPSWVRFIFHPESGDMTSAPT